MDEKQPKPWTRSMTAWGYVGVGACCAVMAAASWLVAIDKMTTDDWLSLVTVMLPAVGAAGSVAGVGHRRAQGGGLR